MAPHWPLLLCARSPHSLLYQVVSQTPYEVHCLDLSELQPKPAVGKRSIYTQNHDIRGMCIAQNGDKQLLIVTDGDRGLFAYNTDTDKLEWKVDQKVLELKLFSGVATDGRGHLFVCDIKKECIQMFSVSDGQYLGSLMKDTETFDGLRELCWCENTSSLVVARKWYRYVYAHTIHIEY